MQKHDYNPLASGQNRIQSPSFPFLPFPVVLSVLSMIRGVSSSHRAEIIKLTMSRSRLLLPLPLQSFSLFSFFLFIFFFLLFFSLQESRLMTTEDSFRRGTTLGNKQITFPLWEYESFCDYIYICVCVYLCMCVCEGMKISSQVSRFSIVFGSRSSVLLLIIIVDTIIRLQYWRCSNCFKYSDYSVVILNLHAFRILYILSIISKFVN